MANSKILGPSPKANVYGSNPKVGNTGNTGGGKSGGPNLPVLPPDSSYAGRRGGDHQGTISGTTQKEDRVPFLPSKAE